MTAIEPSCKKTDLSETKADLPETRGNDTITRKVCVDGNKLHRGKKM